MFSTSDGHTPVSGYSKAKQRVEKRLNEARQEEGLDPLPNWRLHDLRRTVATRMGDLDFTDEVIGLVLNHARKGVTAGYNKSKYRRPKQRALESWARKLEGILGEAESNVVSLPA